MQDAATLHGLPSRQMHTESLSLPSSEARWIARNYTRRSTPRQFRLFSSTPTPRHPTLYASGETVGADRNPKVYGTDVPDWKQGQSRQRSVRGPHTFGVVLIRHISVGGMLGPGRTMRTQERLRSTRMARRMDSSRLLPSWSVSCPPSSGYASASFAKRRHGFPDR